MERLVVSLTDDANSGEDPLEREVAGLAEQLDPVPDAVIENARDAFRRRRPAGAEATDATGGGGATSVPVGRSGN